MYIYVYLWYSIFSFPFFAYFNCSKEVSASDFFGSAKVSQTPAPKAVKKVGTTCTGFELMASVLDIVVVMIVFSLVYI